MVDEALPVWPGGVAVANAHLWQASADAHATARGCRSSEPYQNGLTGPALTGGSHSAGSKHACSAPLRSFHPLRCAFVFDGFCVLRIRSTKKVLRNHPR